MDTKWDNFTLPITCKQLREQSTSSFAFGAERHSGIGVTEKSETHDAPDGKTKWEMAWGIHHYVRTYGWHFAIADCSDEGKSKLPYLVEYELTILNQNNDHFPADESGLIWLYLFCWGLLCCFGGYVFLLLSQFDKPKAEYREEAPSTAITLLTIAYVAQALSVFLEILHLWWYKSDGQGFFFFDFLSEVTEGFSQTMLSVILLSFANGWGLSMSSLLAARGMDNNPILNPDALGSDHPLTYALATFLLISIFLQILNKFAFSDPLTKFHDHETTPGKLLVFIRTVLAVVFIYCMQSNINFQRKNGGRELVKFLYYLLICGGLWFLALPAVVFIAGMFAHYVRHRIVSYGVLLSQTLCLIALSQQLLTTTSQYSRARHGISLFR